MCMGFFFFGVNLNFLCWYFFKDVEVQLSFYLILCKIYFTEEIVDFLFVLANYGICVFLTFSYFDWNRISKLAVGVHVFYFVHVLVWMNVWAETLVYNLFELRINLNTSVLKIIYCTISHLCAMVDRRVFNVFLHIDNEWKVLS